MAGKEIKWLRILHVEDDDNDAILFAKACERAGLAVELYRAVDGEHARTYLLGQGDFLDRARNPLPHLIVLDLKLPRMDGFEFLKWLRSQKMFAALPVLVFTASMASDSESRALAEGAQFYFVKPASFENLVQVVGSFRIPEIGSTGLSDSGGFG